MTSERPAMVLGVVRAIQAVAALPTNRGGRTQPARTTDLASIQYIRLRKTRKERTDKSRRIAKRPLLESRIEHGLR